MIKAIKNLCVVCDKITALTYRQNLSGFDWFSPDFTANLNKCRQNFLITCDLCIYCLFCPQFCQFYLQLLRPINENKSLID